MELKGNRLNSSSTVLLTDIGEQLSGTQEPDTVRGDALVCVTTYTPCCRVCDGTVGGGAGRWLFPNGDAVPFPTSAQYNGGVYKNRGTGLVRLSHPADSTLDIVGYYCCEIPVSSTAIETLCVYVGEHHVLI